jgi:thiamine biosynthesis lipoprotein
MSAEKITKIRIAVLTVFTLAAVLTVLFVVISRRPPQYYIRRDIAFGTNVQIAYATKKNNAKIVVDAMFDELKNLDEIFNPYLETSELYKLNHSDGTWTKVSPRLLNVLEYSMKFAEKTDDAFDPALGNVVALWGFNTDDPNKWRLPSYPEISHALEHSGYKNVEIKGNEVRLLNGVWIDLGAIAKGYAVDVLVKMAKLNDPKSTGYVDVGGDIGIIGPKYGNQPWKIGVRNPRGDMNDSIAYVYLYKGTIATSGDYERFIIKNGKRYYHIFDPKTGYSPNNFESITTISASGILSDAFGTAAMVGGLEKTEEWSKEFGTAYLIVNEKGEIIKNALWKDYEKP